MYTSLPERGQIPLNDDQYHFFQQLISSLSPEQVAWVGGYLSGLMSSRSAAASHEGIADITILVGSQTGNCEYLADQLHHLAADRGLKTVIKKMGDYKLPQLKTEKNLLVIISTYGEGEPPDSSREMYDYLFIEKALPPDTGSGWNHLAAVPSLTRGFIVQVASDQAVASFACTR